MIKTIVLIISLMGVGISLTMFNGRGGRSRIIANVIATGIVLLFVYNIFIGSGFRFRSGDSARANASIDKDHEWLGKIELDGNEFHIFFDPTEKEYITVFVDKLVLGYRSNISTHLFPHFNDSVRTIGSMTVEDDGRLYSVFMVEANDQEIDVLALIDAEGNILTSEKVNLEGPTQIV